jgi:uncharacterized protein (DUF4415 family)
MKKSGNIVQYTSEELNEMIARGEDRTDWARVDALTEEQLEASIDWEEEGLPDWSTLIPGIPDFSVPKKQVTVRLDQDVLDYFKAQGRGYQTRMNAVLRYWMNAHKS